MASPLFLDSNGDLSEVTGLAVEAKQLDGGEQEFTHVTQLVTASGDTTLHTPASGKAVRLRWSYAINDPSSSSPPLITIKLGGDTKFIVYALSKRQVVTGPEDGALVVNLSGAGSVACTFLLEEVTL